MNENDNLALVTRQPGALERAEPGAKHILSGMVEDMLALVPKEQATVPADRFRIGGYELCERDYRQIVLWAGQMGMSPLEVLSRLRPHEKLPDADWTATTITTGSIVALYWDFAVLPLKTLRVSLPSLTQFRSDSGGVLTELDISDSKNLEQLDLGCNGTHLEKLALTGLHKLSKLTCRFGRLRELNLLDVPNLQHLVCGGNLLGSLDLTNVPNLQSLSCYINKLTELDLSSVPRVWYLDVKGNALSMLDIRPLLKLKMLSYDRGKVKLIQRDDQHFRK